MASESQHRQKEKSFVHQQPGRFPFGIAIQFPSAAPPSSYERRNFFLFFFVILFPTHFHFSIWKILTQQLFCVCGMPNQIRRSLISMAGVRATKLDNISWLRRCGDSSDSDNWMCFFFSLSFCWNASENRSNEEEEKQKRTYTKWVERERERSRILDFVSKKGSLALDRRGSRFNVQTHTQCVTAAVVVAPSTIYELVCLVLHSATWATFVNIPGHRHPPIIAGRWTLFCYDTL